jgi:hypothetical protein
VGWGGWGWAGGMGGRAGQRAALFLPALLGHESWDEDKLGLRVATGTALLYSHPPTHTHTPPPPLPSSTLLPNLPFTTSNKLLPPLTGRGAQCRVDYIARFGVAVPVLNFTACWTPGEGAGGGAGGGEEGDVVQLFCVQTTAVQMYRLDPQHCRAGGASLPMCLCAHVFRAAPAASCCCCYLLCGPPLTSVQMCWMRDMHAACADGQLVLWPHK